LNFAILKYFPPTTFTATFDMLFREVSKAQNKREKFFCN
jgi:hypothetical protein